jgi:cytochrome P450
MVALTDVPQATYDFGDPRVMVDPYGVAREMSKEHWIAKTPTGYILLRYRECAEVARDKRFRIPEALGLDTQGITSGLAYEWGSETLLGLDGVEHARIRSLANSAFSRRSSEQNLRPFARQAIRELTADFESAGAGQLEALTNPYALRVICHMLGFPDADWQKVAHWSEKMNQIISVDVVDLIPGIEQTIRELDEYTLGQIERLQASPDSSLGSQLVHAEETGDRLTTLELIRLFESLLMAGSHTVQLQIALGLLQFVKNPTAWNALGEDPDLAEAVTEEVLRYRAPILGVKREAREDLMLRDNVFVPAGTMFTIAIPSANFDESIYAKPAVFDIHRYVDRKAAAAAHQSFGGGAHACIGAHMARLELSEAFRHLAQRLPNIRIDEEDPIGVRWSEPYGIHGPVHTPLRWDVRSA